MLRVADHLKVRVSQLGLSPEEFAWWKWWICKKETDQWKTTDRKDWAMALLTYEVYLLRMTVVGMFSKVTIDRTLADFLPKTARPDKKDLPPPRRQTVEEVSITSKQRWFAAVGLTPPSGN